MKTNLYKIQRQETVTLSEDFKERTLEQLCNLIDEQETIVNIEPVSVKSRKKNVISFIRQFPAVAAIVVFALIGLLMSTYHIDKPDVLTWSEPTYGHDNEVVNSSTDLFSASQGGNDASNVSGVIVESDSENNSDNEVEFEDTTVSGGNGSTSASSTGSEINSQIPTSDTDISVSQKPDKPKPDGGTNDTEDSAGNADSDKLNDLPPATDYEPDGDFSDEPCDETDIDISTDLDMDMDADVSDDDDVDSATPQTSPSKTYVYYYTADRNGVSMLRLLQGEDSITIKEGQRISAYILFRGNANAETLSGAINYNSNAMEIVKNDDGSYAIGSNTTVTHQVQAGRVGWISEYENGSAFSEQGLFLSADFVATKDMQLDSLIDLHELFSLSYTNIADINGNTLLNYELSGEILLSIK